MKKWKSYNPKLANHNYDVIIVGSGIGGLCTAALLSLRGKRVLLLEKHFKIGGWTHTFKRKDYEWDVGIHYIGQVHNPHSPIRKLFDIISDGQLQWSKMDDNYDRIIFPDRSFDLVAPRSRFIEDMISYFPNEEKAILKYIDLLDDVAKSSRTYFSQKAFSGIFDTISYPFMTRKFFKYSDRTTLEVLSELTHDKRLIGVLTGQWGDYGLPPARSSFAMHAFVARHYLNGGNYPNGSSRRIAETISNLIEKNGGTLAVNANVSSIKLHKGRAIGVEMENGDIIEAGKIISNTGVMNTLGNLIPDGYLPRKAFKAIRNVKQTESYVCLHLGIDRPFSELGIKNTNLWIYSDYDHDKSVDKFLNDSSLDFPVLYVSFPSAKDELWNEKYPNKMTMEAITLSRWSWYNQWKNQKWKRRSEKYENYKKELSRRILKIVKNHIKGIESSIEYQELSTPLTVRDLANYQKGEMYGLDHSPQRFRQRWLRPQSTIKNLFFVGQDITTVGVSSALFSGLLTASSVLGKDLSSMLKG
ncbi:MAG: phytoene desaturase family protein [Candidatus Neomarinimicrobiota bacterium]